MKKIFYLAGVFLCFFSNYIFAQDYKIDEIVVTPTKENRLESEVPAIVDIIKREDFEKMCLSEFSDVLQYSKGVFLNKYGSFASQSGLYMRGLYSTHNLVIQDGRILNLPGVGTPKFESVLWKNIDKVEIVKGPFSSLYGSNAVAGVVNILKKYPSLSNKSYEYDISYGSFDTYILSGSVETPLKKDICGIRIDGSYLNTDGDRDNSQAEKYEVETLLKLVLSNEFILKGSLGYSFNSYGVPGPKPAKNSSLRTVSQIIYGNDESSSLKDNSDDKYYFANIILENQKLYANIHYTKWETDFEQYYAYSSSSKYRRNTKNNSYTAGGEINYKLSINESNMLTLGISYDNQMYKNDDENYSINYGTLTCTNIKETRDLVGIFIQDEISLERFFIQLGIRYDEPSDFDGEWSPKCGISYLLPENSKVYFSFGKAFRAPTLSELNWPETAFSVGNKNLDSETSYAFDVGVEKIFNGAFKTDIDLFYQKTKDMIQWAPTGPVSVWGTPKWQPDNVYEVRTYGFEAVAEYAFNENVSMSLDYLYTDAEQEAYELANYYTYAMQKVERDARYVPKNMLKASLNIKNILASEIGVRIDYLYVGKQKNYYTDYSNIDYATGSIQTVEKELDSYSIVNVKFTRGWENAMMYLEITNLFDEDYSTKFGYSLSDEDYPMPGIGAKIGVKVFF